MPQAHIQKYIMRPLKNWLEGLCLFFWTLAIAAAVPLFHGWLISLPIYFISHELARHYPIDPITTMLWVTGIASSVLVRKQIKGELTDTLIEFRARELEQDIQKLDKLKSAIK